MSEKEQTHFGYETIDSEEKEGRVGAVFDSVAGKYDLMNDVMSAGIHRAWKNWYVWQTGVKPGEAVLDLAAGTGDITLRLAKRMRGKGAGADIEGRLVSSDINAANQHLAPARDQRPRAAVVAHLRRGRADAQIFGGKRISHSGKGDGKRGAAFGEA